MLRKNTTSVKTKQMTSPVIVLSMSFMLALSSLLLQIHLAQARATNPFFIPEPEYARDTQYVTTTTSSSPISSIEDPSNSATSESAEDEEINCYHCYDQVKVAQNMVAIQMDLVDKQAKLIRQKNEAASSLSTNPSSTNSRKPKQFRNQQHKSNSTRTSRNRTSSSSNGTTNTENKPIVVSTLRVARSADWLESSGNSGNRRDNVNPLRNNSKPNRDPALKQLKHKQEQQLNETCKSLQELQQCLKVISRACLGDLQYHSHDVYADQIYKKLDCAFVNSTVKSIFTLTPRSLLESEKIPVPRPLSTQEAIQSRLNEIFKGRGMSPFGVMLKPNLTPAASLRFNSVANQANAYDSRIHGGSHLVNIMPNLGATNQLESQLAGMSGQLLLAPCFIVLTIVAVGMISHYIKQTRLIKVES